MFQGNPPKHQYINDFFKKRNKKQPHKNGKVLKSLNIHRTGIAKFDAKGEE